MELPHASKLLDRIGAARAAAGHLFVGLDYDGTLTAIVRHPRDAHLPDEARAVLSRLGARPDTTLAVLSGRSLEDVRARVAVAGVIYGGNHGLELEGPGLRQEHPAAAGAQPALRRLVAALSRQLEGVAGAFVEDKGITVSLHYRAVVEAEQARVRELALHAARSEPAVRVTEGKCVVELRPDVDWDKGAALAFLRASVPYPDAPALFIGDDVTDEDAFRALPRTGWGIVVADPLARPTAACARLRSPAEVVEWLAALAG